MLADDYPRERRANPSEQFHRNSPKSTLTLMNGTPTVPTSTPSTPIARGSKRRAAPGSGDQQSRYPDGLLCRSTGRGPHPTGLQDFRDTSQSFHARTANILDYDLGRGVGLRPPHSPAALALAAVSAAVSKVGPKKVLDTFFS